MMFAPGWRNTITITAGQGPFPAGVTRNPVAFSDPLANVTVSPAAEAGAARTAPARATSQTRFIMPTSLRVPREPAQDGQERF